MPERKSISFSGNDRARQVLIEWWQTLDRNRGDRAVLRRCRNPFEVALTPSYHRLRNTLSTLGGVNDEALSVVVGIVSHVKADDDTADFPSQMASPITIGGKSRVSDLRFRRLLQINNRGDLYSALIRTVRLLGGTVNLASIANAVYWWNEATRKKWAFAYYEAAPSENK